MKAARYYGIQDVRFETVEKPACGPTDALIQVSYAGICGSVGPQAGFSTVSNRTS